MMRTRLGPVAVGAVLLLLSPALASGQDVETMRRELDAMRRQFETVRQEYEKRMQEMAERLRALEAQGPAPTPPVAGPPPAPAVDTAAAPPGAPVGTPTLEQLAAPRQPFALAQPGRTLLFDLGVSGDFVADFTSRERERRHDGTFFGRENRVFPREVSVGFFGRVDPYASAVVRFSGDEEPGGDIETKLDEANVTLLTLPLGTTARFGLMRPRFGTLNVVHQDDLPQVDRPSVLARFFGEEELDTERGAEAFALLPLPFYEELSIGVFDGDNETAFGRGSLRDPLVLGRLRSFFELEEWGGLQIDLSGGTGETRHDGRNTVAGVGLKYKWAPLIGNPFPVVTLSGELIYGNRRVEDVDTRFERWGYYLYGQYDWTRRWAAGLRWDLTELPTARGREWAVSPYLQFKPSEFLRFRVQYKHTDGTGAAERVADELFLQGSFIMGAHPTERF
jgi:hypothetical protein